MNIVLIGMRGAGKTTVAKKVAEKLSRPFIEMDDLIVEKEQMKIPEIVEKHGWDYFRDLESEVASEVATKENVVISAGGGIVTRPENILALKKNGVIVFLQVSVDELLKRIGDDPNRPYLAGKKTVREDMEEVSEERKNLYLSSADEIVDTNNKSVDDVVIDALEKVKGKI